MKKLLLSTALAAVTTFGMTAHASAAQTQTQAQMQTETRTAAQTNSSTSVPAFLSSSFTGMSVYNLDTDTDSAAALRNRNTASQSAQRSSRWARSDTFSSDRNDWNDIGNIKDIVMTQDGAIHGILVDVGGFLGLGVHTVLVDIEELYFVSDSDQTDELEDFFVVIAMTQDELETLPQWNDDLLRAGFDTRNGHAEGTAAMHSGSSAAHRSTMTPAQMRAAESSAVAATARTDAAAEARADAAATRTARTAAETEARETRAAAQAETAAARTEAARVTREERAASQAETTAARDAAARATRQEADAARSRAVFADNYAMLGAEERTVDRLMNADVFDSAGNKVGSVKNVVIGGDDDVLSLLVDIGGFLGMGAHTVNLPIDDARIGWSQSNDSVRVQVDMTRAQLEAMPAHEG